MPAKSKLLFVITEDWYFISHRLALARAASDAGFQVGIATRVANGAERISSEGIELFPLKYMRRASRNPFIELRAVSELADIYMRWRPSISHHVAAKPVIYGGLAARRANVPAVVNALAGFGFVFTSTSAQARLLRPLLLRGYATAMRHPRSRLIVQNHADREAIIRQRLVAPSAIRQIAGSGVGVELFKPSDEACGVPLIVLAGRMLNDKGVREFVDAARVARARGVIARFALVGDTDRDNPAAITTDQLERWHAVGAVEWWGHRVDMAAVLRSAHIVCLPSYHEGMPKVLLEAAASGRPLMASDVPGCREIAIRNETALLVPPRDAKALANAMQALASDAHLRQRLGRRARELVCKKFTLRHVNEQTIEIYRELLRA